ncbi:hypothetical protein KGD82_16525 [Nocardiopsis eucommiae]|uniref:Uncharacterized protein n=1 Tax=Nocardiopsis eucommiae TaxID=2831970 RepID=A0A975QJQ3_9ACTN|nr:hypothetical protein KGD82_16525 [Nocardiopsis eucommiae]
MNPANPWAASDRQHDNTHWQWAVLYGAIRELAITLPTPVNLPHLPYDAAPEAHATAARRVERLRDHHLGRDLPGDILALADRALTDAILAQRDSDPGERRDMIAEAGARVRAVIAYMGIGPEDAGVHDTMEEMIL